MVTPLVPLKNLLDQFFSIQSDEEAAQFFATNFLLNEILAYLHLESEEDRRGFLLGHPVVFSSSVLLYLLQISEFAEALVPLLPEFGVDVAAINNGWNMSTVPRRYPIGEGPVEQLWQEAENGLSFEQALELCTEQSIFARLSPLYVAALSAHCEKLMSTDVQQAARRQRLLVDIIELGDRNGVLIDGGDIWKMRKWAGMSWLHIATLAIHDVPDGRMFHHAVELSGRLALDGEVNTDTEGLGDILHATAVLHLDPYLVGRDQTRYRKSLDIWHQRLTTAFGEEAADIADRWPLPPLREALATAASLVKRAIKVKTGAPRAQSEDVLRQVTKAQTALAHYRDQHQDPRIVENIIDTSLPLLPGLEDKEIVLAKKWARDIDKLLDMPGYYLRGSDRLEYERQKQQAAETLDWLSTVIRFATSWLSSGHDFDAAAILEDEQAKNAAIANGYGPALEYFSGLVQLNAGSEFVSQKKYDRAIAAYFKAARPLMSVRARGHAIACLYRVVDLCKLYDDDVLLEACVSFYNLALLIELELEEEGTRLLQSACQKLTDACIRRSKYGGIILVWQIAKGLRFGTALNAGVAELLHLGDSQRRFDGILRDVLVSDYDSIPVASESEDKFSLLRYVSKLWIEDPKGSPSTLARRRFDEQFERILTSSGAKSRSLPFMGRPLLSFNDIREYIDDRTVVILMFLSEKANGRLAICSLLISKSEGKVVEVELTNIENFIVGQIDGNWHLTAAFVNNIRNEVQEDPPDGQVATSAAIKLLAEAENVLFGEAFELLRKWREAGKDHLCIVPHGPLHYLPFHLIGARGNPIALDWKITYLPNLQLLGLRERRPVSLSKRGSWVASFSVEDARAPGYDRLPEASEEARDIAEIFGGKHIRDEAVTSTELIAHLSSGPRYVHIATHGKMIIDAPSFHHLLLAPHEEKPQRLYAYQLASLDLRGIELLTLGACETALGRFDLGDNLRGLPAMFFLAGVSAIVGTLWDVETNASATFFSSLYKGLKEGLSRLDAFATAQAETRRKHPEYRDWGAFYFMGSWSSRDNMSSVTSVPGIAGLTFSSPD